VPDGMPHWPYSWLRNAIFGRRNRGKASVSVRRLRWIAQENSKIRRAISAG
jgi:hypothetical protein